ncbi:glycosyltransferase family 2 protein [Clostridium botulinum]|uniref:Glycosyltransferase family 2 protein n=1 Tax=Clostridium botulinum TaxID=1491 RepID=A0AAU8Z0B5_CLOBO|nr:glycosyltransferase family 2 protein [Clostridium botulinum]
MPLLSIIIPVYNVENYLEECLNSILDQGFSDYEVILVNDASTDSSGIICNHYSKKYSNFKVIHLEANSLLGAARNIGLKNAKGYYVHFCDADDYYISDSLKSVAEELNNNATDIIIGHFTCKPEKGAFVCSDMNLNFKNHKSIYSSELLQHYICNENFMGTAWRFIVKREFLLKNKIYFVEGYFAEDEEWFPKILCSTNKFYEIKKPFYCYRSRKIGSITSQKTYLHSKSQLKAIINLLKFLSEKKLKNIEKEFIYSRVHHLLGIFSTRCDTFNEEQIKDLVSIIDINIKELNSIEEIYLKEIFLKFIIEYGSYKGICLYKEYIIKETLEKVSGKEDKDIYIFPTGYNGEGTARILKNSGYKVKGFLDNSDIKNGSIIYGLEVNLPSKLKTLSTKKLDNASIIISTQKEQVIEILRNQLKDLGIKDDQISVRVY